MNRPSHAGHVWLFAFVDVLLVLTFVLSAFAFLVLPQINPPADAAKSIPPPGNLAISIAWPAGNDDVDLWATGPGQDIATGYSHKAGKLISLLRDDLGITNDASPINAENAFARETPAGEYAINIHGFRLTGPVMVHVEVALGRSAEAMTLLVSAEILVQPGQEITVIRFRLDGDGNVIRGSENRVFRPLREAGK